ncbi:hypothetical protein VTJ49DRAFT_3621 [Mycothermus thermophilus]|uniref:Uncharacterized protein n=1 Tax=Humicola insolens TaxID=85995 RepID=A0ABR3V932_HUMIN
MSRRTTDPVRPNPQLRWPTVIAYGAAAGLVGVAAMTATERIEQFFTSRPSSQVPGRTLARLLAWMTTTAAGSSSSSVKSIATPAAAEADPAELVRLTWIMHFGQGAVVAVVRAVAAYAWGVRGPVADFLFAGVRLGVDQTLENLTGVGALPWTWPVSEQVIDLLHKTVYAFVTGYLTDRWLQ